MKTNNPSWHQLKGAKRHYRLRNHKAHIKSANYIVSGKAICGMMNFQVWVKPEHVHNTNNNVCAKCLAKLEACNYEN